MKPESNEPLFEPLYRPEKKPSVGKTRRIIGWLLFFIVLAVFSLILARRLSTGFTRYKIVDDEEPGILSDDSLKPKKHFRSRLTGRAAEGYRMTDVRNALSGIVADHEACVNLWDQAQEMLPAGGTRITREVAQAAADRLQPAFGLLNTVDSKITDATTKAELIRIASHQPVDEASKLSSLYVRVDKYITALQENAGFIKNYFENCRAALLAAVQGDYNEYEVKMNIINYDTRKVNDSQDLLDRRISEVEEAASTLFKVSR